MQAVQSEIRTVPRPRCFLCDSEGKALHESLVDFFFNAPGTWNLKQCPNSACGLLWLDPFPLEEDVHLAYQTYYTHAQQATPGKGAGKFRDILYNAYRFLSSLPAMFLGLYKEKMRLEWMFLDELPTGRVLDVGCGDGGFLNRIRQKGWAVEGIDFDQQAIRCAKEKYGLELKQGDLKSSGFPE